MADQEFEQFLKKIGEVIKRARKERGLTQRELGEKIGKPQSVIARLESPVNNDVQLGFLYLICGALEIDISNVLAEALGRSRTSQNLADLELEERWSLLKEKVSFFEQQKQARLLRLFEESALLLE